MQAAILVTSGTLATSDTADISAIENQLRPAELDEWQPGLVIFFFSIKIKNPIYLIKSIFFIKSKGGVFIKKVGRSLKRNSPKKKKILLKKIKYGK